MAISVPGSQKKGVGQSPLKDPVQFLLVVR